MAISSFEIEVNDRLQCLAGSTVAQPLGESVEPSDILDLQGEQFGDGGTPSLRPVGAPDGARQRRSAVFGLALAIACLPLGAGQRALAPRLAGPCAGRHQGSEASARIASRDDNPRAQAIAGVSPNEALIRPERRFSRRR